MEDGKACKKSTGNSGSLGRSEALAGRHLADLFGGRRNLVPPPLLTGGFVLMLVPRPARGRAPPKGSPGLSPEITPS